ncbi:cerebellin 18 [Gadus morhua]|uniref:C1q domain-containing protein n=1 Tax=Gadus morhua TaxID=8049 RepID=A0A8C5C622_GADMO|nr:cerebellin-1-like [Gadus morhua]
MVALSLMSVWGLLCLCTTVHGMGSNIDILAQTAINLPGTLSCGVNWGCDCAFRQKDCCCGAKQFTALEDSIYTRLVAFRMELHDVEMQTEALTKNTHIAFSASMAARSGSFGPFTTNVPIPYTLIATNDGNGYNPALGIFTAPRAGVYSFAYTVYSSVGTTGARLYHNIQLMLNGEVVASTWEDNREDTEDSGSQVVVLQMRRGCQVYMEMVSGRSLAGNTRNAYNHFSGYLVYPDDED